MKAIVSFAVLFVLAALASAEEFMCRPPPGQVQCECTIVVGKGITTVVFDKGDIVSTEAGWLPDRDKGWVKLKNDALPQAGKIPLVVLPAPPISASPVPNMFCLVGLGL